ncbi:MAG: hypothetical protein E3J72_16435 [Planctomycetota bacterium]|nr:MAG: hypothetical protein E3J72_16435 [Planctomycetota bacterium]
MDKRATKQQQLETEGWERMTTMDEPRLSELVEEYKELGFEVHLEPLHPDEETDCTTCMEEEPEKYKTIYVRKNKM